MQAYHRLVSVLQRIRQDVATLLDKEAINAVCLEEKYTWKDRLLNPANAIHLFMLQILNENTPLGAETWTRLVLTAICCPGSWAI